jgi:hypothetical protein
MGDGMRRYVLEERTDGWWVRARSWENDGPEGELVDINGPFGSRGEARGYVAEVQERQVALCDQTWKRVA